MVSIISHYRNANKTKTMYYFTFTSMTNAKKIDNIKSWPCYRSTGIIIHRFWKCKTEPPFWKTVWQTPLILKYPPILKYFKCFLMIILKEPLSLSLPCLHINVCNQISNKFGKFLAIYRSETKRYFYRKTYPGTFQFRSLAVVSDSLQPHEPQHARPSCPSPTPGDYSNSCPSHW